MISSFTVKLFLFLITAPFTFSSNWVGQWKDDVFGGVVYVCISELSEGITVAQGTFSRFGYMRGEIIDSIHWNGYFWMAGLESRQGSFMLTLDNSSDSFTGLFTDTSGYKYQFSGQRLMGPGDMPSDTDCFRTTDEFLASDSPFFSFTGNIQAVNVGNNSTQTRIAYAEQSDLSSKPNMRISWEASYGVGFNFGKVFNDGQVACAQWYESGSREGIELMVARDSSSFYSIWLGAASVSDYNYTYVIVEKHSYGIELNSILDVDAMEDDADKYSYLRLLTSSDEETCNDAMNKLSNDDDNFNGTVWRTVGITVLVILVASVIGNVFFLFHFFVGRRNGKGNQSDNDSLTKRFSEM